MNIVKDTTKDIYQKEKDDLFDKYTNNVDAVFGGGDWMTRKQQAELQLNTKWQKIQGDIKDICDEYQESLDNYTSNKLLGLNQVDTATRENTRSNSIVDLTYGSQNSVEPSPSVQVIQQLQSSNNNRSQSTSSRGIRRRTTRPPSRNSSEDKMNSNSNKVRSSKSKKRVTIPPKLPTINKDKQKHDKRKKMQKLKKQKDKDKTKDKKNTSKNKTKDKKSTSKNKTKDKKSKSKNKNKDKRKDKNRSKKRSKVKIIIPKKGENTNKGKSIRRSTSNSNSRIHKSNSSGRLIHAVSRSNSRRDNSLQDSESQSEEGSSNVDGNTDEFDSESQSVTALREEMFGDDPDFTEADMYRQG